MKKIVSGPALLCHSPGAFSACQVGFFLNANVLVSREFLFSCFMFSARARSEFRRNFSPKSIGVRYRLGGGLRPPHPPLHCYSGGRATPSTLFCNLFGLRLHGRGGADSFYAFLYILEISLSRSHETRHAARADSSHGPPEVDLLWHPCRGRPGALPDSAAPGRNSSFGPGLERLRWSRRGVLRSRFEKLTLQ